MFLCIDCKTNTFKDEYYMVKDEIWPIGHFDGMLCIGCLEERIDRKLTKKDFTDCLVNIRPDSRSERLQNRLNHE